MHMCLKRMAKHVVKLWEALLQSIAALDGTPCGLDGLAAAGQQLNQQCHKFYQLMNKLSKVNGVQKGTWKKLVNDLRVGDTSAYHEACRFTLEFRRAALLLGVYRLGTAKAMFALIQACTDKLRTMTVQHWPDTISACD